MPIDLKNIDLKNITEVKVDGTGSFDKFMSTTFLHVDRAIRKGHITKGAAGEVYTGVIPSMIQEANKFELSAELANQDLANKKLEGLLLAKQTLEVVANTALRKQQLKSEADKLLTEKAQRDNLTAQKALITAQTEDTKQNTLDTIQSIAVKVQQIETAKDKMKTEASQRLNLTAQKALIEAQTNETEQSTLIKTQQVLIEKARVDDVKKETEVKVAQIADIKAGTKVKTQQVLTEKDKLATAAAQRLVLAAQEALYKRQKAGFDDNKHQKILDSQMNAWGITFQDTDTPFIPNQLKQPEFTTSFNNVRKAY